MRKLMEKELIYKIRKIETNEVWIGDSNGVVDFAKTIAENERSVEPNWIEEYRLELQDIGFDFKGELNKFIADFKTAKSFLEIGDEYVISEIGDKREFLKLLTNGYFASTNTEE